MTLSLGLWTILGIVFGVSIIFLFGMWAGMRMTMYGVSKAMEESALKGVIEYNNIRFVPVVKGGKT